MKEFARYIGDYAQSQCLLYNMNWYSELSRKVRCDLLTKSMMNIIEFEVQHIKKY